MNYNTDINIIGSIPDYHLICKALPLLINDTDNLKKSLVTDNEFYNTGIVDVSYRYPKMYVIRPQFFIPIITLLRNAGMKSLEYKAELSIMKNQNVDFKSLIISNK